MFSIRFLINSIKVFFTNQKNNIYIPNFFIKNIIFINPNKIEYINSIPIKFYKQNNQFIKDFNFNKSNKNIDEYKIKNYKFITCEELFVDKIDIKKCKSFFYFKKNISKFKIFKNCKNDNDIINFLQKKIELFKNIKKIGLKKKFHNNLEFMIDSKKNLVKINSGNHRFIISKILKLKKIPIEIMIIHSKAFNKNSNKVSISEINSFLKKIESKYA